MNPSRWNVVQPSQYPWEREALDFLRAGLPDHEPYRAWANFEFITPEGQVYEVDLLVVTKLGLWLVEVKSRPGTVTGDYHTWTWSEPGGRRVTADSPYLLANRKARALASILSSPSTAKLASSAFARRARGRVPMRSRSGGISSASSPPRALSSSARPWSGSRRTGSAR
jgi:Nuclease-related domain